MVIIHSDREGFTNFDNVLTVNLMGRYIHATLSTGKVAMIGVYEDSDRAIEVFTDMMATLFPEPYEVDSDKIMPFISSWSYEEVDDVPVFPMFLQQFYYMPEK